MRILYVDLDCVRADHLSLDIDSPELPVSGSLDFTSLRPWPVTLRSPGIMGWYAWAPFMECYHGIVSLDHVIEGTLTINGTAADFSGGRGYTEKDWGKALPEAWVWFQVHWRAAEEKTFLRRQRKCNLYIRKSRACPKQCSTARLRHKQGNWCVARDKPSSVRHGQQ